MFVVELLDEFAGVDVSGGLPGVCVMVVVSPLDEVVDASSYSFGIKDTFYFVHVITFDVERNRLGVTVKDRARVRGNVGFVEDIVLPFALPFVRDVELVGRLAYSLKDMEGAKSF